MATWFLTDMTMSMTILILMRTITGIPMPISHGDGHPHVHRNLFDIYQIIDKLESNDRVKELARRMFRIVAEAESKAHGLPVDQVHFHEVGAIDSIVDVIGAAVCMDNLARRKSCFPRSPRARLRPLPARRDAGAGAGGGEYRGGKPSPS